MQIKPILRLVTPALALSFLLGCASTGINGRIQEKSAEFSKLDPATQQIVRKGGLNLGYTKDMAYMALGNPSKAETKSSPDGPVDIWIYKNAIVPADHRYAGMTFQFNSDVEIVGSGNAMAPGYQLPGRHTAKTGSQESSGINANALWQANEPADLPTGTLYVFFYRDHIFKMIMGK